MVNGPDNLAAGKLGVPLTRPGSTPAGGPEGASFADMLRESIDEVARLQRDASTAVQSLATGQTDDVAGVLTAVEKSSLAFKTLLAIRGKLMDAYDEIKQISV